MDPPGAGAKGFPRSAPAFKLQSQAARSTSPLQVGDEVESFLQETHATSDFEAPAVVLEDQSTDSGFTPGAVVADRFRVDAYLAAGGMGRVYRAHDLKLDFPMALKTIHPEIASNPAYLRLFKQEVLLARSISQSQRLPDLRPLAR